VHGRAGASLSDMLVVIATAMNKEGVCAVLTGDAAAAMHVGDMRAPARLDYTLTAPVAASRLASAIRHLGFEPVGSHEHRHAHTGTLLAVSDPPLAVGGNTKVIAQTLKLRHGFVRILSTPDCCREQLLLWKAAKRGTAMQAAVDLARTGEVNMIEMHAWMQAEGLRAAWPGFRRAAAGSHGERTAGTARPAPNRPR
jgi:hypothetical protein